MFRLLPMICRIALRNVLRQRRRSLLTISAVAFGIFCLVIFQALKVGLHRKMIDSALGMDSGAVHIHARGYESNMPLLQPLPDPRAVFAALTGPEAENAAGRIKTPALILAGARSSSVVLSGIDFAREKKITFIHQKMVDGPYAAGPSELLLSRTLALSLGLRQGDKVDLLAQDSFGKPTARRLTVAGLYSTGLDSFDRTHIYCSQATARSLLALEEDALTEIVLAPPAPEAEAISAKLAAVLGDPYQVRAWPEFAPDLRQLMDLNDVTFALLVLILFAIVAMGIANTMTTVVFERFREIGTLAAIGTTPAEIVMLIGVESIQLGLIATGIGTAAAGLACFWLQFHGIDLAHFTSANQYFASGSVINAYLRGGDVAAAIGLALATALVAGIYPALRAARLQPARALRFF